MSKGRFIHKNAYEDFINCPNEMETIYFCDKKYFVPLYTEVCVGQKILVSKGVPVIKYHDKVYESNLAAVKLDGNALQRIKNQSFEMCFYAIIQNPSALQFVKHQTVNLCIVAVENDVNALQYVQKDVLHDVHLAIVKTNGCALKYIKHQDQYAKLCQIAIKQNYKSFKYVSEQTEKMCIYAVKQNGLNLEYVKNQTDKICFAAIRNDICVFKYIREPKLLARYVQSYYIKNMHTIEYFWAPRNIRINHPLLKFDQTYKLCLNAVKSNGESLKFITNQTEKLCITAVKHHGSALRFVKKQTYKICAAALKNDGSAIEYVENKTHELCKIALQQNGAAIIHLNYVG